MACFHILFILILISSALSVNSELAAEKLIGGIPVVPGEFTHHVGIIGKRNKSRLNFLACAAGILSDFFLLSSSECFLDPRDQTLMKLRFYVIFGSANLRNDYKKKQEIMYIHTLTDNPAWNKYFIAVLQLADSLHLNVNLHLKKLSLPPDDAIFMGQCQVAGYGFRSYEEKQRLAGKDRDTVSSRKDNILTWAHVKIVNDQICENVYPDIVISRQMCGTITAIGLERRGLCSQEEGAPLVIGDYVVGIANRHRLDCDNTKYGHTFSRTSFYRQFILGVIYANPVRGTHVHTNRPLIKSEKSGS